MKPPIHPGIETGPFLATAAVSVIASITLALVLYAYVPVSVDGAWYSYPAYALSQGGDPSENIPDVERPSPPPDRVVAKFGWQNRTNLTVLLSDGWFKAFAPSWVSLKVFGAAQLMALAILSGFAVLRLTGTPVLGVFAGCLVASDARVIAEAMSDVRPDLLVAVFAVLLLLVLIDAYRALKPASIAAAAAVAAALPLLHLTAATAIAFFLAFVACCAWVGRHLEKAGDRVLIGLLTATVLVGAFVLRPAILDILIPTHVPAAVEDQYAAHFRDEFAHIVWGGTAAKLMMELGRWTGYFFRANTVHFVLVLIALIIATRVIRKRHFDLPTTMALSLLAGFFTAAVFMLLVDSHDLVPHVLPVAVLGYAGCVATLDVAHRQSLLATTRLAQICYGTLALGGLLNFADASILYRQYSRARYSNAAAEAFLVKALPERGDVKIIAPTEVWPYLVERKQPLLLIDDRAVFRHKGYVFDLMKDAPFAGASYLVLNRKYHNVYGWEAAAETWSKRGLIVSRAQLGDCDSTADCLRIYTLATPNGN